MLTDGRQVRAARAILGLTQDEFARLAQVHRNSLSALEAGPVRAQASTVTERIGSVLASTGIAFEAEGPISVIRYPLRGSAGG